MTDGVPEQSEVEYSSNVTAPRARVAARGNIIQTEICGKATAPIYFLPEYQSTKKEKVWCSFARQRSLRVKAGAMGSK